MYRPEVGPSNRRSPPSAIFFVYYRSKPWIEYGYFAYGVSTKVMAR